jgi:hypothetical protein
VYLKVVIRDFATLSQLAAQQQATLWDRHKRLNAIRDAL